MEQVVKETIVAIKESDKDTKQILEEAKWIRVRGAREHNLKNINVDIPRNQFVVITGLSGSGKSSLAIDTLFAEGQRRFLESLSSYARQFVGKLEKPLVDHITGLSPAICIDQKTTSANPRSTVGTVTEIYDYLRVLFASIGVPFCPRGHGEVLPTSVQEIINAVLSLPEKTKISIIAPVVRQRKGHYKALFEDMVAKGYTEAIVDGERLDLTEKELDLDKKKKHSIEIVIDKLRVVEKNKERIADGIEQALQLANGIVSVKVLREDKTEEQMLFSETGSCPKCGFAAPELEPRLFSFNSPQGACPSCTGLGVVLRADPDLIIPDKTKTIREGAILPLSKSPDSWSLRIIASLGEQYGFTLDTPINQISSEGLDALLFGSKKAVNVEISSKSVDSEFSWSYKKPTEGIVNAIQRRHRQTKSESMRTYYESFMSEYICEECNGTRLNPTALSVKIAGYSIAQINEMSVREAYEFLSNLDQRLSKKERLISEQILKELRERLGFLISVGLDYLTLNRKASTLSGGEAQRIRLATQIGSKLVGVLYVLDEPSIGLHPRDTARLIATFKQLRSLGNSVLVVEHDELTIRSADYVLDMGPGAGLNGGWVVAQGTVEEILHHRESLTAKYLRGELKIRVPEKRRQAKGWLVLTGVRHNNLKDVTVKFPLGTFTCITGVSGSGKSSLVQEVLWRILARKFYNSRERPGEYKTIEGLNLIDKVILIDQSPIGRTPRSNPATYTKVFDHIRDFFAKLPESRKRGYKPGRFSFNVKGGRCEACRGNGDVKVELHFLPDVYVPCDVCGGTRFNEETLEVKYKEKNISEVLDLTIDEAFEFFEGLPRIQRILKTLIDVGCGYLKLGQSSVTLSGGEAQRIKLSRELAKRTTGKTVILLDEPTTGLHFHDVRRLLSVIHRLVDKGNTVMVIEHNLDVIKNADYIIDLGPEGGDLGGEIVATGTPEEVSRHSKSYTGKFLREVLDNDPQTE